MYYVYFIQSINHSKRHYVGLTTDLKRRMTDHNSGLSIHTNKFRPWKIISYIAFVDRSKAEKFEIYLKTASGKAFARKRF
ncbi:MAG: GIY-YIG nuclease family protein [Alphaproteobacteria bacterium]|nr:MAG: GIY-YIG nuclease family protein [Alphaproteobacteria bacterium]